MICKLNLLNLYIYLFYHFFVLTLKEHIFPQRAMKLLVSMVLHLDHLSRALLSSAVHAGLSSIVALRM